ncbi:hypothetical protein [Streptomyces sp. R44]|uniref:Uncharacterized protein n=1 Tax=Streptomyces sp. R44 TaxID=3238633 RepID=A0AB39TBA0_9ACTN
MPPGGPPTPPSPASRAAPAVLVSAALGATALTLLWTVLALTTEIMGTTIRGDALPADCPSRSGGWMAASSYVCYAPLVLWGPLLALLTVAYGRRRRQG